MAESSNISTINMLIEEFGTQHFAVNGVNILCKLCSKEVKGTKRKYLTQHCNTKKHKTQVAASNEEEGTESNASSNSTCTTQKEFYHDLCKMLVAANIPISKVENTHFISFMQKYVKKELPSQSTLRKYYLPKCYDDVISRIRQNVGDNKIWISIDETTDAVGRFVANVIVGILSSDKPNKTFLLTSEVIERVDHLNIISVFETAMALLWPDKIKHENVVLFITDAASYMLKAAKELQLLFPKMIHLTCLAHGLHRIAEEIRSCYSNVNTFISNVKKIFLKSPSRVAKFREMAPGVALPPQPIVTRWGTWLDAAVYYSIHYKKIVDIIKTFTSEDCSAIRATESVVSNELFEDLLCIKNNFACVSKTIKSLESKNMKLSDSLKLLEELCNKINNAAAGPITNKIQCKLKSVLDKNPGYKVMVNINNTLQSVNKGPSHSQQDLDLQDFMFVPLTSCAVERSFSEYKHCLSDSRRRFTFENFKQYIVVYCNRLDDPVDDVT